VVPTAAGGADGLRRVAISPSRLDDSSHAVDSAAVAASGVLSGTTVRALVLQAASVTHTHTHTHTHPFNGPLSGTTQVSWYQKGKTNLDFTEARDSEWQWLQLGHMLVCTSIQTDNHSNTPPLSFLQARCPSCCPANSVKALKAQMTNPSHIKCLAILACDIYIHGYLSQITIHISD